jgi:NADPH:quinone reductase-like Zn-dependent oxidoreductase
MKAILLRRPGGPEALEYVEVPTPVPGEGKVLVKADTIGVSMPEVLVRRGTYAWMPALPAIPGIELSGASVLPDLLDGKETRVWGDQAYHGQRGFLSGLLREFSGLGLTGSRRSAPCSASPLATHPSPTTC